MKLSNFDRWLTTDPRDIQQQEYEYNLQQQEKRENMGKITQQEAVENINVLAVSYEVTAWKKTIDFEYQAERYWCQVSWSKENGYEIEEWGNIPLEIRDGADRFICQILDEKSDELGDEVDFYA